MKISTVRDGRGQIIGTTTEFSNGDVVARDRSGHILGHSSKTFGNTRDNNGRLVSTNTSDTGLLFGRRK